MTMDLALIAIIKIIFVSVDLKIALVLLLEKALGGEYLLLANNTTKFGPPRNKTFLKYELKN